ncbi:hypothetical protein P691DRAFT_787750 [Macrolepiota fuliginosa MF-IS2]|uniref:Uncharacterized protein n=1 Tax=Macrolepiota fuliginosa MF-IS2 TaxID=1400762 RepID=A0A9P6CAT6_9AGAR|nr:hypothetical protein P691DRAFT_787750 [Macrolepiota fuliginosa MF-IS2]
MAQAVFDEHPLEQYLRDAGEDVDIMPGTTAVLMQEIEPFPSFPLTDSDDADTTEADWEWRPQILIHLLYLIETFISTAQLTNPTNPLVERFKYNVISSSLLSPDLTPPHVHTPSRHHTIPGNLPHSRTSSELSQQSQPHSVVPTCSPEISASLETQYGMLSGLVVIVAMLLSAGLTTLAISTLWTGLAGIYYLWVQTHAAKQIDLTPCLETLDELISTNTEWESIVQEVIITLETDERSVLGSTTASSHTSPSSSLRVALHSTLQTTQTQCDNVRHLLSALTSPSDLSQLSEMYAPPSPVKPSFSLHDSRSPTRPASFPSHKRREQERPTSATVFTDHKRMTWNGPHSHPSGGAGTGLGSMTPPLMKKRRLRYRSDLSFLGNSSSSTSPSFSAPVTPAPSSPLARVSEADSSLLDDTFDHPHILKDEELEGEGEAREVDQDGNASFAAAALKMQRTRTNNGLEALSSSVSPVSSPSRTRSRSGYGYSHSPGHVFNSPISNRGRSSTFQTSSRFTSLHTSRQPLSLSALRHALQSALGAKRYACAHLLALRFREEDTSALVPTTPIPTPTSTSSPEVPPTPGSPGSPDAITALLSPMEGVLVGMDGTYWDDVKSVMELLISTLSDASARLCEAVREVEVLRLRDQTPTPCGSVDETSRNGSPAGSPRIGAGVGLGSEGGVEVELRKVVVERRRMSGVFGSIGGGSIGLGREGGVVSFAPLPSQFSRFAGHVATIKSALDDARLYMEECVGTLRECDVDAGSHLARHQGGEEGEEHPALKAYEKLRRELGFALRECERGRNRLVDIVKPPTPVVDAEDEEGGVPELGHEPSSSEPDGVVSPLRSEDENVVAKDDVGFVGMEDHLAMLEDALVLGADDDDDVTQLPPAHVGIEQVFEADTSASAVPVRQKSKLSREERIKLVKARRESVAKSGLGLGLGLEPSPVIFGDGDGDVKGGHEEKWGPGGDVVQELKDVIWKVGERRRKVVQQQQQSSSDRTEEMQPPLQPVQEHQFQQAEAETSPSVPIEEETSSCLPYLQSTVTMLDANPQPPSLPVSEPTPELGSSSSLLPASEPTPELRLPSPLSPVSELRPSSSLLPVSEPTPESRLPSSLLPRPSSLPAPESRLPSSPLPQPATATSARPKAPARRGIGAPVSPSPLGKASRSSKVVSMIGTPSPVRSMIPKRTSFISVSPSASTSTSSSTSPAGQMKAGMKSLFASLKRELDVGVKKGGGEEVVLSSD